MTMPRTRRRIEPRNIITPVTLYFQGDEAPSHYCAVCAAAVVGALLAPPTGRAMKPLERLGEARTPNGTLIVLYRHDGAYLIRADGVELMSTRRHLSEDRLAEVACAPIRDRAQARVLIGGLGLGFTLRAALHQLGDDAEVVVAELVPEVVAWNVDPRYGLSVDAMIDPRVRVLQDDVSNVLRTSPGAFDAIMLDTDNGPEGMLMSENARLYATRGIGVTVAALRAGGSIVYWSVGDDPKFARALRGAGLDVDTLRVRAHDTTGPMHTLYVATRRSVTRPLPV